MWLAGTPQRSQAPAAALHPSQPHVLPLHKGSKKIAPRSGPCIQAALKPGEEQEGRELTPCQLRGCQQPAPRLPPRQPRLDGNWLQFPLASAQSCCAVSLPKALALGHLHNTGCSFLPAIEVTASRTETTEGERKQQQREKSCLVQGQEQQGHPRASRDPTPSTAPLSPPTASLGAVQPPSTGLPPLQPSPGCSAMQGGHRGKALGLVWLLGQGGAQIPRPGWGALPLSLIPWGRGLVRLTNPQHLVLIAVPGSVSYHPPVSWGTPPALPHPDQVSAAQLRASPRHKQISSRSFLHCTGFEPTLFPFTQRTESNFTLLCEHKKREYEGVGAVYPFITHTHKKKKPPRGLT